ncbi:MAG: lipocalin-like domain-containing protein [Spirosomaceae bacterium]|jgi:hypothetical protein|nr:lipocalin-like domain-containing protein [Spirosomataceae bacterium]
MKLIQRLMVILVGLAIITISSFTSKKKLSVDGAWTFVKVQTIRPDGSISTTIPKEGQAIFQKNHYSFCWTSHNSTSHSWQLTDAEKLDRFNQSIINTGTYELKDSVLTTKASFAMSPMFSNGIAKFKCSFSGDTLVLRGLSVFSADNIAHPVYANGSYIVSKLLPVSRK